LYYRGKISRQKRSLEACREIKEWNAGENLFSNGYTSVGQHGHVQVVAGCWRHWAGDVQYCMVKGHYAERERGCTMQ